MKLDTVLKVLRSFAVVAVGGLLAACSSPPAEEPPATRADIVLILIDTFRPDHLGINGYERSTAPFLEGLMERSTVFHRAYSTSSWTAPSTSSLMTGLYPTKHGVTEGFLAHQRRSKALDDLVGATISLNRLPSDVATLPELLRDAGYGTFGLATNINIGPEIGFDRGFDRFEKMTERSARRVAEKLEGWRQEIEAARPSFVYLHFNDVHEPYQPRAPWFVEHEDELARTVSAYDSEISFLDGVLAELSERFAWDRDTYVVVVSDHGEEFGEHGKIGHGFSLFEELMRVLVVVSGADLGVTAKTVDVGVSLIDVAPTILDLAGVDAPQGLDGRSLTPLLPADGSEALLAELERRTLFAHRSRHRVSQGLPEEHLWAAVKGTWKLIDHPKGTRLYDLERDPAEKRNRARRRPRIAEELGQELERFRADGIRRTDDFFEVELDPETLKVLESLGYIQ